MSHIFPDGSEHPIAFAFRTLIPIERNYAQIQKEASGLVFGMQHFHQYLYGCRFTLVTDNKPLMTILIPKKGIPSLAAARFQQFWMILLSRYCYEIEFRSTHQHYNADALSRLPLDVKDSKNGSEASLFNIYQIETIPVTATEIQRASRRDPVSQSCASLRTKWLARAYVWTVEDIPCQAARDFSRGGLFTMGYACHYYKMFT